MKDCQVLDSRIGKNEGGNNHHTEVIVGGFNTDDLHKVTRALIRITIIIIEIFIQGKLQALLSLRALFQVFHISVYFDVNESLKKT